MSLRTFRDFDAYAAAIRDVDVRVMLPRLDRPFWSIDQVELGRLRVQHGREGSGLICEGVARGAGWWLFVPLRAPETFTWNGEHLDERSLVVVPPGADFCVSAVRDHDWCSLFFPADLVAAGTEGANAGALAGCSQVACLPGERVVRARQLARRLTNAAQRNPALFPSSAAAALEADFVAVLREALAASARKPSPTLGRPTVPRGRIVRQSLGWLEGQNGPASVEELAAAAAVSQRTLRTAFNDYFGVGPVRYLKLRQLHQVRRALRQAGREQTTVTEVAVRFGVWELGRFAHEYRLLFGELPSATLHRGSSLYEQAVADGALGLRRESARSGKSKTDAIPAPTRAAAFSGGIRSVSTPISVMATTSGSAVPESSARGTRSRRGR
jgi:AraC family ethanolamine operon transcriptional activator